MCRLLLSGFLLLASFSLVAQALPRGASEAVPSRRSSPSPRSESPANVRTAEPLSAPTPPRHYAPPTPPYRPERLSAEPSVRPTPNARGYTDDPYRRTREGASAPYRPGQPQEQPAVSVRWLTFEEATERSKADKRKIFIEVYTDWCGWCKRLDAVTFADSAVAQYLNENYYPVKFNAESSEEIVFHQKTYALRRQGGRSYHELAVELLNGRLSFPTLVFLDENLNVIQAIAGYQEPDKLFTILNYFGTDSHKTTPWDVYERRFNQQH